MDNTKKKRARVCLIEGREGGRKERKKKPRGLFYLIGTYLCVSADNDE